MYYNEKNHQTDLCTPTPHCLIHGIYYCGSTCDMDSAKRVQDTRMKKGEANLLGPGYPEQKVP